MQDCRWLRGHVKAISLLGSVVAGYEAVEVADGSGVAPGSVRKSIQRACERMRARVEADDEALRLRTAGPG